MKGSDERREPTPPQLGDYVIQSSSGDTEIDARFYSKADARKAAIERWGLGGYRWVEVPGKVGAKMGLPLIT